LQTPVGPEALLLKRTLKFRVEEGHFSCLRSRTSIRSCPRSVVGGLQRVAETIIAPVSLVEMENTQPVAGGWSWQWAERSTPKLGTDLLNAITFIWIFIRIFSTVFLSSVLCKLLRLFCG